MDNEAKKIEVRCECGSSDLQVPSFEATVGFLNAINVELYGVAPFSQRSPIQSKSCLACQGEGVVYSQNGPDDYDKEFCSACNGTGRVVAN